MEIRVLTVDEQTILVQMLRSNFISHFTRKLETEQKEQNTTPTARLAYVQRHPHSWLACFEPFC